MQKLLKRLRSSAYASQIGWLVRGNLIAQVLQVLALPVISRIYSPEDFGVYSLLLAFVGFGVVGLTMRFESTLLIAKDEEVDVLLATAMRLALLLSILAAALLHLLSQLSLFGFGILPYWVCLLAVPILAGHGFFNTGRAERLRNADARTVSRARVEKSAGNVAVKIVSGLWLAGPVGLILGEIVGAWMAFRRVGRRFGTVLRRSGLLVRDSKTMWRRYRKFPLVELPSSLADQAALLLPVAMIASIGGAAAAGAFGMARIIVVLPNSQIGRAVADGFQSRAGELVRASQYSYLLPLCLKTMAGLGGVGLVPYGLFFLLSPLLFPLMLGEQWGLAGDYAAWLAIWMFTAFMVSPVSRLLSVLSKQEFKLFYDVSVLGGGLLLYWYALENDAGTMEFLKGLVLLNVVAYFLYSVLILFVAGRSATKDAK